MKQILGDNQFFGVNHFDIDKGDNIKENFSSNESIISFIQDSILLGLDGFMINSNIRGYEIANLISKTIQAETHYSIPYPHKFASMVNEDGMLSLIKYIINKSSLKSLLIHFPRFLFSGDFKFIIPLIIDLEIPYNLKKGSYVYLQNIVTDLLLGMKRYDLLNSFCSAILKKGYFPGLITLNPILLEKAINDFDNNLKEHLIVCFNINNGGFNVFPNLNEVETFAKRKTLFKKMGMSILSSGGTQNIQDSLLYIKKLPLDYVVYGSSNLKNINSNFKFLK